MKSISNMKTMIKTNVGLSVRQSKGFSNFRGLTLFFVVAIFALCGTKYTFAAGTSVLGDQDYADGDIIGSNSTWTAAQAGEPYPFDTIHVAPKTIVFTHSGLDTGREGILTFSLWDIDADFAGNQVAAFSLDGIPQDISAFEVSGTDLRVKIFSFLIDPGFLSDGELVVSISFESPPAGNEVGIDFSRVEVPPTPVTVPGIQRWSVTNGFYALNIFGDGTILAASDTFVSGAGSGVQLDPRTGAVIRPFSGPDVRTSIRLSSGDQDHVVGGYAGRRAVRQDGTLVRGLMEDLGCCNIPRFPMALDLQRDDSYVLANGALFVAGMSTGFKYFFYDAGDTFGMVSIAQSDLLYTAGRSGNVTRLHPTSGRQWTANIASGDLQPGAVAADDSFIITSGSPHFAGATSPGRLARILPDGTVAWNKMVNAVTPPVVGGNGLIFVGTQAAPIDANGAGAIEAHDPADGRIVWRASVSGLPNDLLVGDDGAVYAGTGSFTNGNVYAISQSDGTIRRVITNVPGAWEIVLRAGLLYASGTSITAIPVDAVNYDLNSPWAVRFHDNQRTGNRQTPILTPPRESGATNIDPQAYAGNYILYNTDTNTNLGTFSGVQSLNLTAGNYKFDNYNQVGASSFDFSVNQFGQVSNISNPNAAQAVGNTLRLNNATLNIEPGGYTGRYKFLATNSFHTGTQSFVVVPGLRYGIDNGTGRGGATAQSYFYFDVGTGGAISNIDVPAAAVGDGNTLRFNNTTLIIEPNGYTGNYNLSSHYTVAPYVSGRRSFVMIPGLLYAFDAGTGSYEPTFKLDANGSPTNIDPAGFASGINNILVLANVSVHVDPTNYGGNYRLNDRVFSGIQNLVLIPQMRFYVAVNNSAGYFTPTNTLVTPPSVTLNDGGNNYIFNFFVNESCPTQLPGLISWWRGEGNALDSVGTNNGTLQGDTTYTAGKTGQGFKFQNFFNDWVKVDSQVYEMQGGTVSTWFNWDGNEPANWFSGSVILGSWQGGATSSPTVWIKYGTLWWDFSDSIFYGAASDTQIPIVPGRWYHVSVTYDSNYVAKLYLNGVLVASRNAVDPVDFRDEFGIGRGAGVTAVGMSGVIDETQIYNRPLSDCEVRNLYNSANGLPCEICDNVAPTTTAARNPNANPAGWNNSNVVVSLSSADNANGTGVSQITYSASGAQTIAPTTVNGSIVNLTLSAEGETVISYFAHDNAGNAEAAQTLVVKIDKTAPLITSSATAGGNPYSAGNWTNQNVTVSFDCTDSGSGVGSVTQPVTLSGEGANQSANGVCTDVAGNNANNSFANVKIDKTAPTISVTAPTSGNYLLNQAVTVSFTCTDSLSGVSSCTGTTANGSSLDTASPGAKTFTVNASDNAGNSASPTTVNYTVNFGLVVLFDQTKAHKSGSTVPIKIRLVDANGANVSSAGTVVHAISVVQVGSQASPILEDAGNSNPDFDFRYDQGLGGYIFNLKTTGYGTGTYQLNFIAGNTATIYSLQFQVRQ